MQNPTDTTSTSPPTSATASMSASAVPGSGTTSTTPAPNAKAPVNKPRSHSVTAGGAQGSTTTTGRKSLAPPTVPVIFVPEEQGDFATEVCGCLVKYQAEPTLIGNRYNVTNRATTATQSPQPQQQHQPLPEETSHRFMAYIAQTHEIAWSFLKSKPTGGFAVLVLDLMGDAPGSHGVGLYLDTRVCETSYCFRLVDKKGIQENQIVLEEDNARRLRSTKLSSSFNNKQLSTTKKPLKVLTRPVLITGNHNIFRRLEQLWKEFILYFEIFAYDMHRIEFFELEQDSMTHKDWVNKMLAGDRKLGSHSILLDEIANDQIPTIHLQMLTVKPTNPHCCVVNMVKKLSSYDQATSSSSLCCSWMRRDAGRRLSLRILEFDFTKLCIVITDTFLRQPSLFYFKAFMEKHTVYQLDIKLVSFFEVYQSFATPKQILLKNRFRRSSTMGQVIRSHLSNSSQSVRSEKITIVSASSSTTQEFPTEDLVLRAIFISCLEEFDLVIKSREIRPSLQKELMQLLEQLYKIRGRKMRFSLETNLCRTRLVMFLLELLAASNETSEIKQQIKHLKQLQKVLRLAVLLLTTKTAEKCFFVAFHAINKVFSLLFDSHRQICSQMWFLLMEMIEHDKLYRELIIDKAREIFASGNHAKASHNSQEHNNTGSDDNGPNQRPKCVYMYFQPSLVHYFILQHMDNGQSVFVDRKSSITSISSVVATNSSLVSDEQVAGQMGDVLGYELIVRLAKVLLVDVTNMVGIERSAATIVNYPHIYDNLFDRILHWTLQKSCSSDDNNNNNVEVATRVLSILWQSVSLLQRLEPHAKVPTPKQLVFMASFNEHLHAFSVRVSSNDLVLILSPQENVILGIIGEYIRRGNSMRIDEFILVCLEQLLGLIKEFVKSAGRQPVAENGEVASVLIDVWRILLEKTRTRELREILLRFVEEEELSLFQLFEVLIHCLEDQPAWGTTIRRMTMFAETLVRLSRGETLYHSNAEDQGIKPRDYEPTVQTKANELISRILPQPVRTHGRTFASLILQFMLKITSMPGLWRTEHLTLVPLFVRVYGVRQMANSVALETREKFIRFHLDKIEPERLWEQEADVVELSHAMGLHTKGLIVLATNPHNLETFVRLNALARLLTELPSFLNRRKVILTTTHGGMHLPPLPDIIAHPHSTDAVVAGSPSHGHDYPNSPGRHTNSLPESPHPIDQALNTCSRTSSCSLEKVSVHDGILQVHAFVVILIMVLASAGSPTLELDDNFCARFTIDKGGMTALEFLQQQLTTFMVLDKQNGVSSFAQAMAELKKNRLVESSRSDKLVNLWQRLSTKP